MVHDNTALRALERFDRLDMSSRSTYAFARVEHLAEVHDDLRPTDRHHLAASIWSDFIDGRQTGWNNADDGERAEQANLLARLAPHFAAEELLSLAVDAWGQRTLEVPLVETGSAAPLLVLGRFAWYPEREVIVVEWHPRGTTPGAHLLAHGGLWPHVHTRALHTFRSLLLSGLVA